MTRFFLVKPSLQNSLLYLLILPFAAIVLLSGCASSVSLSSAVRDRDVSIDGVERDWMGALTPVAKEDFSIGLLNDEEFLYVSFITGSAELQSRIIAQGLIVWIDREGGKKKDFGIKYPIGLLASDANLNPLIMQQNPGLAEKYLNESLEHFELYGSDDKEGTRYTRTDLESLEIRANALNGSFVYELKLPIEGDPGYALNPGETDIGIGFETPDIDRDELEESLRRQEQMAGTAQNAGMGNRFSGAGLPTGLTGELKFWATLKLAGSWSN